MSGSESKGGEISGLAMSGVRDDMKLCEKSGMRVRAGAGGQMSGEIRPAMATCRERIRLSIGSGEKKRTPANFDFLQEFLKIEICIGSSIFFNQERPTPWRNGRLPAAGGDQK